MKTARDQIAIENWKSLNNFLAALLLGAGLLYLGWNIFVIQKNVGIKPEMWAAYLTLLPLMIFPGMLLWGAYLVKNHKRFGYYIAPAFMFMMFLAPGLKAKLVGFVILLPFVIPSFLLLAKLFPEHHWFSGRPKK